MSQLSVQDRESAETLALRVLGFLAGQENLLSVFLEASGCGAADLAEAAQDPQFLSAVLDFLLMEDRWVLDFAGFEGISPEAVLRARALLPGGDLPNWT
jgi:hypothetical protein